MTSGRAAGGAKWLNAPAQADSTSQTLALISRMKGHEDDGMFFGKIEALSLDYARDAFDPILRKEVIQPQVPLRLPCYDFTPVADPTVVCCLLAVSAQPSGETNSHGVTGGVYKAWERIHRGVLIRDY